MKEREMQPVYREEFGLHWLYNKFDEHAGLLPFAEEALLLLRRLIKDKEIYPSTHTTATSARSLVVYWLDYGKLPMHHRGRVINEQLSGVPVGGELSDYISHSETLDGQTTILCDDLVRLMQKEGMTVPPFLQQVPSTERAAAPAIDAPSSADALPVSTRPAAPASEAGAPVVKGLTKNQILAAFGKLVLEKMNLEKAMGDGATKWLLDARLSKGSRGRGRHQAQWHPVILAVALRERQYVTKGALTRAFFDHSFLADWREAWKEQEESLD